MGRTPCCEEMGLRKGPWTPEEDFILTSYIQQHGHGNWRALPRLAGLLRCGKSCRLRWVNYLCPDVKRGNFTEDEEDTIIKLHGVLGNRWSAIAARLPGRTDNEIKNFWHTRLKKRSERHPPAAASSRKNLRKGIQKSIRRDESSQIQFHASYAGLHDQQQFFDPSMIQSRNLPPDRHHPQESLNLGEDTKEGNPNVCFKEDHMDFWHSLLLNAGDRLGG